MGSQEAASSPGCPKGFYGKHCRKKCHCASRGRCYRHGPASDSGALRPPATWVSPTDPWALGSEVGRGHRVGWVLPAWVQLVFNHVFIDKDMGAQTRSPAGGEGLRPQSPLTVLAARASGWGLLALVSGLQAWGRGRPTPPPQPRKLQVTQLVLALEFPGSKSRAPSGFLAPPSPGSRRPGWCRERRWAAGEARRPLPSG